MVAGSIGITPGSGANVRTYTAPDTFLMQSINLSDPTTGKTVSVTDNGAGQESLNVSGAYKEFSGLSAGSLNADLLSQQDAYAYKSGTLDLRGTWTGTVTVQVSNDGTNWSPLSTVVPQGDSTASNALISNNLYEFAIPATRYIRIRMTSYTSGSATAVVELSTAASAPHAVNSRITSMSNTGSSVPGAAHYIAMNGSGGNLKGLNSYANATDGANTDTSLSTGLSLYNGATTDKLRNNWNTSTGDTGAKTGTFNGAAVTNYNNSFAIITVVCGTVSGTTPTMNAQIQYSPDGGTTWINYGPASSNVTATNNTIVFVVGPSNFSQAAGTTPANLTTGATQTVAINSPLPRTWRVAYTIGGTTPSFAITGTYVNYVGL